MILSCGQTDIGKRRKINEDSLFAQNGLFIVCDGMGGHQAGEVASALAVETIARFMERSSDDRELTWPYGFNPGLSYNGNRLRTAVKLANRAVFRKANSAEDYTGMGTTAVIALVSGDSEFLTCASVGDSRIYLIRGGAILQLTQDDSWANLVWPDDPPEETPASGSMKHVLTKALGARDDVEFDVMDHPFRVGDVVLLCSDGLTNMLPDSRILEHIVENQGDVEAAARLLIAAANAEGGRDNITVVLLARRP
jgi:PPM family protein phosphatase